MSFVDLAALTIHDVKNRLALLAARAEARGDADSLRDLLAAAATLSNLLAFYKAETGHLGIDVDGCVPADLIAELSADAHRMTTMEIVTDCSEAPELWFYDANLIRMVLANALHNALRFARLKITLSAHAVDDWLEFSVSDDGPGYPDAVLAVDAPSQPLTRDGTGIGLHLARQVVALHANAGLSGRIELSNQGGAVFRLLLPR